jgi:CheY-like chemotaxis protein
MASSVVIGEASGMPTVLVVDDDFGFRRVVTRLLRARGFDVVAEA